MTFANIDGVYEEIISLNQYYQNNAKSAFLGGCYTYDWIVDGQNEDGDIFHMIFTNVDEGAVLIKKAILIGKNGRQLPFKRIINTPNRVVYRGNLPKEQRVNAKIRYWRPNDKSKSEVLLANTINVCENWNITEE